MTVLKTIRARRSIREFTGEIPPAEVLDRLVDALRWAPSAGNLQSRRFYFVGNRRMRARLAQTAHQPFVAAAPIVVVACADDRIRREYGERGVELYGLLDVAAAVQNMLLVAEEQGLGACWVGAFDEERVAALLDLPTCLRPVSLVPLGYPAEAPEAPGRRSRKRVAVLDDALGGG
ncbi:MAG: nitroreductase family protein [Planctomycetota bacterium]|jgi:nitroreductase